MAPWAPCEWSAGRPHTGVRAVTLTPAPACGWGPCQRPPRICPAREGTRKVNTVHGIFHPNTRLISVTARLEVSDERQRRLYSTRRQRIVVPAMTSRRKAEDAEVMFWVLSGFTSASACAQPASFSMVGTECSPAPALRTPRLSTLPAAFHIGLEVLVNARRQEKEIKDIEIGKRRILS